MRNIRNFSPAAVQRATQILSTALYVENQDIGRRKMMCFSRQKSFAEKNKEHFCVA